MPRRPRMVFAGLPHHVTQRGNRRERVFFTQDDRLAYLVWLRKYAGQYDIDVLAYCLMTNHVHLVLVPATEAGLHRALKPLHMRYAQHVNRARGWRGHVWQGRFFSSALDDAYLWTAIRYVERNPVRAGMVQRAEDYPWSSAGAHCGLKSDSLLTIKPLWQRRFAEIGDWSAWLAELGDPKEVDVLRHHSLMGFPCGSPAFVAKLEQATSRRLQRRSAGRPKKET